MANIKFVQELEAIVQDRLKQSPDDSYTAKLAQKGIAAAAQKIGEEGVETALAAVIGKDDEIIAESADLLFHLLVVLAMKEIPFASVVEELEQRHQERNAK